MIKKQITFAIFLTSVLLISGCQKRQDVIVDSNGTAITLTTPTRVDVASIEKSIGQIDAKNAPIINSEVNGQIIQVLCEVGDRVKKGQTLAIIDASQYSNAADSSSANVKLLESQVENQRKTVARYEELIKQNFISEAKLDELKTALKGYEEQLKAAKAGLKESSRTSGKTIIKAPVDGFVYARNISVGDFATVGKALFGVANLKNVVIKAPFPETIAGKIRKGQKAKLYTHDKNSSVDGIISDIRPFVSASGRSFEAIISMQNPGEWIIGASISVDVITDEHKGALVVPENAVVLRPAGSVVYVINANSVKQKVVQTGQRQDGFIEIISGLSDGEKIANDGAGLLSDGAKVNIVTK